MKLKSLSLILSKEDILSLISLQDKLSIKGLYLGSEIGLSGIYKLVGLNIDFETKLAISGCVNNTIYIDIKDFKVSKKNSINPLVKSSISFITKLINDIDGMRLKDNLLTIDVEKIIKEYCTDIYGLKLNNLSIKELNSKEEEIELIVDEVSVSKIC